MFYGVASNFRIYKKRKQAGEKTESAKEGETGGKTEKEKMMKMIRKRGRRV